MRRLTRYVPAALLVLGIATPFVAGCGLLKPKENDAGADGAVVTPAVTDTTQPANPAQPATPAAPLNPATPGHPATPAHHTDGGAVADSGAHTDGGAVPAPLPTFPGFDAGALKGFDAGGLFRVPDGGFKPPPWPAPPK
jgi:hypothetical protein